ncbi:MAG: hypothetical protein QG652_1621 [Pseudomonadota bacterium]|nr:hypothetical protein [Pseudomonadota bacterium]
MNQEILQSTETRVLYTIDHDDRLVYLNDVWDRFALENASGHLTGERIRNQRLWDFIADAETRHLHQVLVKRIRTRQVPVQLPFRCDSPSVRRYMMMEMVPAPEAAVEYRCTVLRIEQRAPVLFMEQKGWRGDTLIRMCSWCKKVHTGEDVWMEIEDAIQELQLFERKRLPEISHTMCDECLHQLDDI